MLVLPLVTELVLRGLMYSIGSYVTVTVSHGILLVLQGLMYSIGSYASVTVSHGISPAGINVQYRLIF